MLLTIIIFILILAVLVVAHEFGHFFSARKFGMYVEEFAIGFPPRVISWVKNGTRISINAVPLGGYVKIPGENGEETLTPEEEKVVNPEQLFSKKPAWKRIVVLCAGVLMNVLVGWLLLIPVFVHGIGSGVTVISVSKDSPAYQAGIQAGDRIDGFSSVAQFVETVKSQAGKEMSVTISHEGSEKNITVVPRQNPPSGEGALGVGLSEEGITAVPFGQAIVDAGNMALQVFGAIFVLLFKLIGGLLGLTSGNMFQYITGPVGVFQATAQASALGWVHVLYLAAIISLNLAAVNIFPFPALDGGRVLLVVIEKIKRSPVSARTQAVVNGVGFFVLIALLLFISVRDVIRIW
ncbi:MAG: M50 family metallopeptidase [Patescibacteria group bacterium]|nr:M50 family metallopeptidase [Patescibacteria group bacterium]